MAGWQSLEGAEAAGGQEIGDAGSVAGTVGRE